MDNFHIDITSEGDLAKAMEIAFQRPTQKAEGYLVDPKFGLIFFWSCSDSYPPQGLVRLPFKLDSAGAADFARRWLEEQDYGREPDHDGDNGRGWRMYNNDWSKVNGLSYSIVAVQPAWAMYGK